MRYLLLNQNTELLEFETREIIGTTKCVELQRFQENLPEWLKDINEWVNNRNYAKHKSQFKRWLREWGIDNTDGFLSITHALGLNDTLWVKPADSDLTWDRVNLYRNDFDDISERTAFETGLAGLRLTSTSPELTSEGSFEKCWKREEDGIFIYKKGSEGFAYAGLEPYSEYYAFPFAEAICEKAIYYDLIKFKGHLCSKCALFTSEQYGFIPMYKVYKGDSIDPQAALDFCASLGFEQEFREMMVLDSVILNPDRHTGNFGFLIDNTTFEIIGFAPMFDHNFSLLCRAMRSDLCSESALLDYMSMLGHKIGDRYIPAAKALLNDTIRERLLSIKDMDIKEHSLYNLPKERLCTLNSIIHNYIDQILEISPARAFEPVS